VLLKSDGTVVACGANNHGQCDIPAAGEDLKYTQVAATHRHTVALKSDGMAVACGRYHPSRIPAAVENLKYTQVATRDSHTVLLRSDGMVVAVGVHGAEWFEDKECNIPAPGDHNYIQITAGTSHTVLLKSDGTVVACGDNGSGRCDIPAAGENLKYSQIAAGANHTVLLKSNGTVVACGDNFDGQCDIPAPDKDLKYTQVAAGGLHTLLLKSDGTVVACGGRSCDRGQCNIPAAGEDLKYTQVAAGHMHTVLLRSDGSVVACGDNDKRQCDIPAGDFVRMAIDPLVVTRIVQVSAECASDDTTVVTCSNMGGETIATISCGPKDTAWHLQSKIAKVLEEEPAALQVILPSGAQLEDEVAHIPLCDLLRLA
jgi:alpha-tubulin suppressor-like RCC1 family protein